MSLWHHDQQQFDYNAADDVVPVDSIIKRLGNFTFDRTNLINSASGFTPIKWMDLATAENYNMLQQEFEREKNNYIVQRKVWWERAAGLGRPAIDILNFIGVDRHTHPNINKNITGSFITRQRLGQGMFLHFDMLGQPYNEQHDFKRLVVFLSDWKPGQLWMFGNSYFTHWHQGDAITFDWTKVPYGNVNLCTDMMHVLHITTLATPRVCEFISSGSANTNYVKDGDIYVAK